MMRAWENRSDVQVWDEPLYPLWLSRTGTKHPGHEVVLEQQQSDLDATDVIRRLGSSPHGVGIFYQKHMAHHLSHDLTGEWMLHARHALLVRRPDRVLASLLARYPEATVQDTGLPQQVALISRLDELGVALPPVIDADDVLVAPEVMLRCLCQALDVPWDEAMLQWPPGKRGSDGSWAPWWYDRVWESTCFGPPREDNPKIPEAHQATLRKCQQLYEQLSEFRLRPQKG
ncbi:MAG: HAD family hydrolase [Planctomycetes bacterium]|nr:HAD family hydrolase [Planctomycetota bacterium]MCP4840028.1 HAD family hydrolase [Planctomycetota bacterium]